MVTNIVNHLRKEHNNLNGLLNILLRQLQSIKDGDKPDYFLMYDIIHYLTFYSDHYHHPLEDLIYARLAKKNSNLNDVVNTVKEQHRQIAKYGETLFAKINEIIRGSVVSRELIYSDGCDYIRLYQNHMETEETELFEALHDTFNSSDWLLTTSAFEWRPDPISSEEVSNEYERLRDAITNGDAGDWPWNKCLDSSCPVCSSV